MKHYTCTECGLETEAAGVCTDVECIREGKDLTACECLDGEHGADYEEDYFAH